MSYEDDGSRLAASNPPLDRARLYSFIDDYLDALENKDTRSLPVTENVRFSENNRLMPLGTGAWETVTALDRRYEIRAADPAGGQVGYVGTVRLGDTASFLAIRLHIEDNLISEIETIVPGTSVSKLFSAATANLEHARSVFSDAIPPSARDSRSQLLFVANAYYEGLEQEDSHPVPFADDCHRIENGVALTNNPDFHYGYVAANGTELPNFAAMGCMEVANSGMFNADLINARRYPIVDEEHGIVFAFTFYQARAKGTPTFSPIYGELIPDDRHQRRRTLVMLEVFKVVEGRITAMESVWSVEEPTWQSVWWTGMDRGGR